MAEFESDNILGVQVDNEAATTLLDSAKWSRFIAIVYFIAFGLCTLLILFLLISQQDDLKRVLGEQDVDVSILYIFLIPAFAVMFYLGYLLHRFSSLTRRAIHSQDPDLLGRGVAAMKNYLLVYAIFAVIGIVVTVITLITGTPV